MNLDGRPDFSPGAEVLHLPASAVDNGQNLQIPAQTQRVVADESHTGPSRRI
jgi:hypothetical protein